MVVTDVDSQALAAGLRPILLRLARHLRSETHKRGLNGGQVSILVAIEFHPGITSQEVAVREGLSAPGVSGHLARLEGRGLIRRERKPGGLHVGLYLTSTGETVLDAIRQVRTTWLQTRLATLTPNERRAIKEALPALQRLSIGDR